MAIRNIRYYIDPETGSPHIYNHAITEDEVEQVLARPVENRQGYEGARVAIGQTPAGRYLRVIYVPDPEPGSVFDYVVRIARQGIDRVSSAQTKEAEMKTKHFPAGWDEERVHRVLSHYEQQTDEQSAAEDEAAFKGKGQTVVQVPVELMPVIREMIAQYQATAKA